MRRAQLERRLPRYLSSIPKTELPHVVDEENQARKLWGGGVVGGVEGGGGRTSQMGHLWKM